MLVTRENGSQLVLPKAAGGIDVVDSYPMGGWSQRMQGGGCGFTT